ncbi:ABC transporter substrate-binding protein [Micromonospora andamanensis]|uniref:ABC transporter substrate-binding protein n=1 Tax=Micromonospora andamanensis TaxID=1287068 RepID=A0ABQ4I3P4_9ACTN|nr:ABC transporter substrate-binding protein [Micromonospora andamanensis]GIJ12508.1 ABC transporter substrate-binding protein [Micromonospora andamanensis]
MRRAMWLSAVVLLFVTACGGGSSVPDAAAEAEVKPPGTLVKPGTLTVAADFQGPPFDYVENGKQRGFDVEFDKAVAELMGLRLNAVDARFASLVPGLEAGRYDAVVSVLYITQERAKVIDLVPYAQTGSGFLVRKNNGFQPKAAEELCGRKVAVLAGGFEERMATGKLTADCRGKGQPLEVKSFPSDVEATKDVADGRADVFFTNHSIVLYRAEKLPELNLVVSNPAPLFPVPAGIGVRKDRPEVKRAFEEAIAKLRVSGELRTLLNKYGLQEPDQELVSRALAGPLY